MPSAPRFNERLCFFQVLRSRFRGRKTAPKSPETHGLWQLMGLRCKRERKALSFETGTNDYPTGCSSTARPNHPAVPHPRNASVLVLGTKFARKAVKTPSAVLNDVPFTATSQSQFRWWDVEQGESRATWHSLKLPSVLEGCRKCDAQQPQVAADERTIRQFCGPKNGATWRSHFCTLQQTLQRRPENWGRNPAPKQGPCFCQKSPQVARNFCIGCVSAKRR